MGILAQNREIRLEENGENMKSDVTKENAFNHLPPVRQSPDAKALPSQPQL